METGFEVQLGGTGEDNAQHTYRKAKTLLGSEAEDGPPTHQDANACDSEAEDDPPAHQACGSEAEDTHLPTKVPMRADEPWYVLVLARAHTTQPARVQSCAVPVVYEAPSPQTEPAGRTRTCPRKVLVWEPRESVASHRLKIEMGAVLCGRREESRVKLNPGLVRPISPKTVTYTEREYLQAEAALTEVEMQGTLQKSRRRKNGMPKKASTCRRASNICRRYARTMYRGATRTILFSSRRERRTANGPGDTDIRPFFEKEVADPGPLEKGDLPMPCRPREVRTTPHERKCRLANHSNGNRGAIPFFGPVPWLWYTFLEQLRICRVYSV